MTDTYETVPTVETDESQYNEITDPYFSVFTLATEMIASDESFDREKLRERFHEETASVDSMTIEWDIENAVDADKLAAELNSGDE